MIARLQDHLRTPLYRNGYSLILSSIATSGLGILYWILAARLYPTETVGLNSAVLSSMIFLSNIAQLNLTNGLNRFLPAAGKQTPRLILNAYLVSILLTMIAGLVFVFGVKTWAPRLDFIASSLTFILIFVLSTAAYGIFALQDSALTGLRQAVIIPVENTVFSILKIVFLAAFINLIPAYGIIASWLVPLMLTLLVVNWLLFRGMIPAHIKKTKENSQPVSIRRMANYVASDYIGSLFWVGAVALQPIVVTQLAGPAQNAYYYLSWQIAYALYLIARNMGNSLIAEVAAAPEKLADYSWRALVSISRLILPAVAILYIGAHPILRLFGEGYSENAATLLRLLALSAIPQMIIAMYLSVARVQGHMRSLILVQAVVSLSVLVLSYILLINYGITGIGVAWLVAQTGVAVFLALTSLRNVFLSHLNLQFPLRVLSFLRRLGRKRSDGRQIEVVNQRLPAILHAASLQTGQQAIEEQWQAQKVIRTVSDVTVVTLGPDHAGPRALLKLATSTNAVDSLRSQISILSTLRADRRINGWSRLMPKLIAEGEIEGQYFSMEEVLPGVDGRTLIAQPEACRRMLPAALAVIEDFHMRTVTTTQVTPDLLRRWVDRRLEAVRQVNTPSSLLIHRQHGINRLAGELYSSLIGKNLAVSWIHGDYFPGNILVTPDGSAVQGVIDWDLAAEDFPLVDHMHFLLSMRILTTGHELGDIVRALLKGSSHWTDEELALLTSAQEKLPGQPMDLRSLLLLAWLRHVASNLTKSTRYANQLLWVTKNVEVVLGNL